jgi:hypothetical protein
MALLYEGDLVMSGIAGIVLIAIASYAVGMAFNRPPHMQKAPSRAQRRQQSRR